ncbi:MAG: 2-polyprenylphenol 6-hydroxylase [Geminicoccaceae bacterium]|nr:2-polyprenylphenol 6-hydroxylase [Geminicoccaceae bacterium]
MFRTLRNVWRLIGIARGLARHDALFALELVPQARPFLKLAGPFVNRRAPGRPGQRLARALEEQGPCFIKFGQSLATRADLLGDAIARDLAQLQDRLPSFPAKEARRTIERELDGPIDAHFTRFTDEPVAAASIAQVHFAVTPDGREVAVKILRPNIELAIERDLDLLMWAATMIERGQPHLRRYRPVEAVRIFAISTRREMDLRLEAAAAAELAANCADDEGFRVPDVDWQRTAKRVATFERVAGLHVDDRDALLTAGLAPDLILERAAAVFFNQVFRDGFFHGDMHPGNMLIDAQGCIVALDFGIMGRIDMSHRRYLARMLVSFLARDYAGVAAVFFDAGFVPPDEDRAAFTQACRAIGEPILDRPLAEISFGRLLGQILGIAEEFRMQTQPQLLLLQKTMVVAEGVGRLLNPNVNMWQLAQPLVEQWITRHLGPQAQVQEMLTDTLGAARRLPKLVHDLDEALLAIRRAPVRIERRMRDDLLIVALVATIALLALLS